MRRPNDLQWWSLLIAALLVVFLWPPGNDRSLAVQFVNWAVDPWDELPVLLDQLPLEQGDDPVAVAQRDMQVQQYDELYLKGGWTRWRLELKVARDPLNPATERQVLTGIAVVIAFLVWRWGGRKN